MAVSYTPTIPSGSTNGRPIAVGTSATTLHTDGNTTNVMDEVWVHLNNTTSAAITVTVRAGTDEIASDVSIGPNEGPVMVVPGIRVNGGVVIDAQGSAVGVEATVVVNRINTAA